MALLRPVLTDLAGIAERIDPSLGHLPTPCAEYDVATLTCHVVGWLENFARGFASIEGICPLKDVTTVQAPIAQAAARIREAGVLLDNAVQDGAAERPLVIIDAGGMPGPMALSMILGEYVVHGWDLAAATGQPWLPDPVAAGIAHEFLTTMVMPEHRGPDGMFDEQVTVAEDAGPLDRLLGFTGRDPAWSA